MFEADAFSASDSEEGLTPLPATPSIVAVRFHSPADPEFSPHAAPLQSRGSSSTVSGNNGDGWLSCACRCLRCEVLRVGQAASSSSMMTHDSCVKPDAKHQPQPPLRGGQPRQPRSSTSLRVLVILDLDNFGFPQFKQPVPDVLLAMLLSGRIFLWAFYGAYFARFFGTSAEEYLSHIPVGSVEQLLAQQRHRCSTGSETTTTLGTRRASVKRKRPEEGAEQSSSSSMSTWAALKCAAALHLTPAGGESQAVDRVVLQAIGVAAALGLVLAATGDRALQSEIARTYPSESCRVITTRHVRSSAEFWGAVEREATRFVK